MCVSDINVLIFLIWFCFVAGHSYYVMLRVPPNSTVSTLPADMVRRYS